MVSRAFQVLSDPDKKSKFDNFGGDPDNRFGPGSASAQSPFSGFARSPGRGPMFEDEISPEEMFNRFFGGGGGMGGGFGPFGRDFPTETVLFHRWLTSPQVVACSMRALSSCLI